MITTGHRLQLQTGGTAAGQVVAHPRELAGEHAQPLAALRGLEPEQLLDPEAVAEVAEDRRVVVQAIGVGNCLIPGTGLTFLLEAAVEVADLHIEIDDGLSVELDHELHRTVGGRVGGTHVEHLVLGVEIARP